MPEFWNPENATGENLLITYDIKVICTNVGYETYKSTSYWVFDVIDK